MLVRLWIEGKWWTAPKNMLRSSVCLPWYFLKALVKLSLLKPLTKMLKIFKMIKPPYTTYNPSLIWPTVIHLYMPLLSVYQDRIIKQMYSMQSLHLLVEYSIISYIMRAVHWELLLCKTGLVSLTIKPEGITW